CYFRAGARPSRYRRPPWTSEILREPHRQLRAHRRDHVTGNACRKKRDKPTQGTGGRYRLLRPMRHYHRIRLLAYEFAYNGDIGFVEAIDLELGEMTIAFDGRSVAYAFGELDQIVLAYATTIHKSQGSEFPA